MNISAWSIRQPIPALVLFVVLCALGVFTFLNMTVTRFPNIDVPVIAISVTQSGAAPSELESQVTKRVEDAVSSITGVKHIASSVKDGSSQTVIEFQIGLDTDRALNDVKDAIAKIRGELPRSIDEPVTQRIDVEGQAIMTFSVAAPNLTLEELSWYVDDTVKRELQGLKGVGRVERYGGVSREIRLALNPDRLMALGVTAADVSRQLRATNADLAGGRSEIGGQEQAIRTLSSAQSLEALGNTEIALPGGRRVRLADLGLIQDTAEEPRSFSRVDSEPVVSFAVFRAKGASDVTVAEVVQKKIAELTSKRPEVETKLIDDSVAYTVGNYEAAMVTLLEGSALAVLVVLIFLGDWRATLIAAVALPLSVIPTFWIMDLMGFSLNLVSLLAMTLATGILVDDAIVEIENIVRHMRMGKSAYRASLEAADEIGMAVIAISFTIVAVFAPVSFMGGIAGQYFKQFGLTVAVAVIISLLVARLLTPMMTAYLMRSSPEHVVHEDGWMMRVYTWFLRLTMYWRWSHWLMVFPFIAIVWGWVWATQFIPSGLFPIPDEFAHRHAGRAAAWLAARRHGQQDRRDGAPDQRDRGSRVRVRAGRCQTDGPGRSAQRNDHRAPETKGRPGHHTETDRGQGRAAFGRYDGCAHRLCERSRRAWHHRLGARRRDEGLATRRCQASRRRSGVLRGSRTSRPMLASTGRKSGLSRSSTRSPGSVSRPS